jgi:Xaa-Pro aminopeptidase
LLITCRANLRYLTGLRGTSGAALLTARSLDLIVDFRYYAQAATEAPDSRRVLVEGARFDVAIADAIRAAGVVRLAFEADHLTFAEHMALEPRLPEDCRFVPSRGLVEVIRAVKDAGEVAMIRMAAAITSETVAAAIASTDPGMTERELAARIEAGFRARGADGLAFPTLVASGPRSALPHPRPTDRRMAAGEWGLVDAGAMVDGYRADMTRSFVLGRPTAAQVEAWEAVHAALRAGLAAVRPGVPARAIDEACRRVLQSRGFGLGFGHDTGHGVGLDLHELPNIGPGGDDLLVAGMVITVEPGLYEPGVGGVRLEELCLVRPEGAELLTTAPLALASLPSVKRS